MSSLLLVGLSPRIAGFLEKRLRGAPWKIVDAPDLADAEAAVKRGAPAAIVVDLRRRPASDRIAGWRRRGFAMPILVLAGPAGEHVDAMEAGATDYLLEPFEPEAVAVRIESRLHPPVPLEDTLRLASGVVHLERSVVERDGREVRLSATERDLLVFLASRPGRTLTKSTLLQQVWGYRPGVQSRTATVTMARLRAKIELDPANPVHIQSIHGVGYRFDPAATEPAAPVHVVASRFFGREAELDALVALLDEARQGEAARLVTLVGTGGVGKTRLAREVTTRLGGGWFCDLSDAHDLGGVIRAVAAGLGASIDRGDPEEQIAVALAERKGSLVVLDNLEQVADAAGAALGRWVPRAPETRFLLTSRVPLRLTGERLFPIEPLPVPPEGADTTLLERNPAAALFLDRARAARPDVVVASAEEDISAIVRMLDGLPLALELAAARVRVLPLRALREQLSEPLRVLAAPRRDASQRQATLRAAIDWSWDLLTPDERRVFATCSVFAGGFGLDAAEAVLDVPWALDSLQGLVDHGLIRVMPAGDEPRFAWLETLHAYASEKLVGDARAEAEARHGAWFAELGTQRSLDALREHGGVELTRALLRDLDNLLVAVDRAVRAGALAVAVACARAAADGLYLVGPHRTAMEVLDRVLALPLDAADRVPLLIQRAWTAQTLIGPDGFGADVERALALVTPGTTDEARLWAMRGLVMEARGENEEGVAQKRAALAVLEAAGATWDAARVHMLIGNVDLETDRYPSAREALETALVAVQELGDRRLEGLIHGNLAIVDLRQGRLHEANDKYERALAIHVEVGNARLELMTLGNLAANELALGRIDDCERHSAEAIARSRRLGLGRQLALTLGNLGNLRLWQGRFDEAIACYREAAALLEQRNEPRHQGLFLGNLASVLGRTEPLPIADARFEELRAAFDEALTVHRGAGSRRGEAMVLLNLADFCRRAGRVAQARTAADASLEIWDEVGDVRYQGLIRCVRGDVRIADDLGEARRDIEDGLALLNAADAFHELADGMCRRARLELTEGDAERARGTADEIEARMADRGVAGGEVRWMLDELRPLLGAAGSDGSTRRWTGGGK